MTIIAPPGAQKGANGDITSLSGLNSLAARLNSTTAIGMQIFGINSQTSDYLRFSSVSGSNVFARFDKAGHLGIAATPTNALVFLGSGSGTLTDNVSGGSMGLKVKLDTTTAGAIDAIQSNLKVIAGTTGNKSARAIVGRIDNADATGTGDIVAVWGDIFTSIDASTHNTWGANIYNYVGAGGVVTPNQFTYNKAALGAEFGLANFAIQTTDVSTIQSAGTLTNGSATVTGVSALGGYTNGAAVSGSGIPAGTTVLSGAGTSTITLSQVATGDGPVTLTLGARANVGCVLHPVATGTNPIRSYIQLASGGNPSDSGGNASNNVQHFLLCADDTPGGTGAVGAGPAINLLYYGPLTTGNLPTGTPKTVIDKFGWLGLGMAPASSPAYNPAPGGIPAASGGLAVAGPASFSGPVTGVDQFFHTHAFGAVATLPWLLAGTAIGSTSGAIVAAVVYPKANITISSCLFVTGSSAPAGITECRVGIWSASGVLIAQSDNMASAVTAANQTITATFTANGPVTLSGSTAYYVGVAYVGTTPPGIRGVNLGSTTLANRAMPNAGGVTPATRTASGFASGTLPALTATSTNVVPYLELI